MLKVKAHSGTHLLQVMFEVINRLKQKLGSVVPSLFDAPWCCAIVTRVKAVYGDDLQWALYSGFGVTHGLLYVVMLLCSRVKQNSRMHTHL